MLEIQLKVLHHGIARTVVTLDLGLGSPAEEFLLELSQTNQQAFRKLAGRIRAVSEHADYQNDITYKSLKGGLYEFKIRKPAIRLYAFHDRLCQEHLIIAACGGAKGTQSRDIDRARKMRQKYLSAKSRPDTTIRIIE